MIQCSIRVPLVRDGKSVVAPVSEYAIRLRGMPHLWQGVARSKCGELDHASAGGQIELVQWHVPVRVENLEPTLLFLEEFLMVGIEPPLNLRFP